MWLSKINSQERNEKILWTGKEEIREKFEGVRKYKRGDKYLR